MNTTELGTPIGVFTPRSADYPGEIILRCISGIAILSEVLPICLKGGGVAPSRLHPRVYHGYLGRKIDSGLGRKGRENKISEGTETTIKKRKKPE
jgi:hypothetical protein